MLFFPTSWHADETSVRIYGLKEECDKACCIVVKNVKSSAYIQLPENISWTEALCDQLMRLISRQSSVVDYSRVKKHVLMGAHVSKDKTRKFFDFLHVKFATHKAATDCEFQMRFGVCLPSIGRIFLKVHMTGIELWVQLALMRNLPICDWFCVQNPQVVLDDFKQTKCLFEWTAEVHQLYPVESKPTPPNIPLLAYDIECYTPNHACFTNADIESNEIFQVSMIFGNQYFLISRGRCDENELKKRFADATVELISVNSEFDLIEAFVTQISLLQPLIVMGFNSMGFDGPYMIKRAKSYANCFHKMEQLTLHRFLRAEHRIDKWTSSAHKDQVFQFMRGEGIAQVDLMKVIQKDHKLMSYSLDSVAEHFLNSHKDGVSPVQMFKAWEASVKNPYSQNAVDMLTKVGAYCLQDSILVVELVEKLKVVNSMIALANTTNCKIEDLTVRGASHKVMSCIIRFCFKNNIIVDQLRKTDREDFDDSYRGAIVFQPSIGLWHNVVSFDFASLYPSLIRAYNFCASTLVAENDTSISDEDCIVLEWQDHVKCEHDEDWIRLKSLKAQLTQAKKLASADGSATQICIDLVEQINAFGNLDNTKFFCAKRRFRWLKQEVYHGIYPQIVELLLQKRAQVRQTLKQRIASNKNSTDNTLANEIIALDAEQVALKIVANSLYGFTGSAQSPIPCRAIAMCTTFTGRQIISHASDLIRDRFGGFRIYGDTDSNYVKFEIPQIKSMFPQYEGQDDYSILFDFATRVAKDVSGACPGPLNLEFEGAIYKNWLITNKKSYVYQKMLPDGSTAQKLEFKGILLKRRDQCMWVKNVYEFAVRRIFEHIPNRNICDAIAEFCIAFQQRQVSTKLLTISKSVLSFGDGSIKVSADGKTRIGDYCVVALPKNEAEAKRKIAAAGFTSHQDYYASKMLPHVRLAKKLAARGVPIGVGQRLSYVVTGSHSFKEKIGDRLEDYDWFSANADIFSIDKLYYINSLAGSLETLLRAVGSTNDYVYKRHVCVNSRCVNFNSENFEACGKCNVYHSFIHGVCFNCDYIRQKPLQLDETRYMKVRNQQQSKKCLHNDTTMFDDIWYLEHNKYKLPTHAHFELTQTISDILSALDDIDDDISQMPVEQKSTFLQKLTKWIKQSKCLILCHSCRLRKTIEENKLKNACERGFLLQMITKNKMCAELAQRFRSN